MAGGEIYVPQEDNEPFWSKEFVVVSVTRADLVAGGIPKFIAEAMTNEHMQRIATQMEEYYVQNGTYWDDVPHAAQHILEQDARQGETDDRPDEFSGMEQEI